MFSASKSAYIHQLTGALRAADYPRTLIVPKNAADVWALITSIMGPKTPEDRVIRNAVMECNHISIITVLLAMAHDPDTVIQERIESAAGDVDKLFERVAAFVKILIDKPDTVARLYPNPAKEEDFTNAAANAAIALIEQCGCTANETKGRLPCPLLMCHKAPPLLGKHERSPSPSPSSPPGKKAKEEECPSTPPPVYPPSSPLEDYAAMLVVIGVSSGDIPRSPLSTMELKAVLERIDNGSIRVNYGHTATAKGLFEDMNALLLERDMPGAPRRDDRPM